MANRLSLGIDRSPPRLTPRVVWSLLGETIVEWYEDRAPRLGAALAFYTVFALAPGLIVIIAVAALLLGQEAAQGQIINEVQDLIGVAGAQAIQAAIESARSAGGSLVATGLGVLTLLFGLWGVFGELQDALNTIWGVTTRPWRGVIGVIKERFWSFTMVVGIGFLLLVSLAASAWLAAVGKFFARLSPLPAAVMETANALLSFVIIALMFAVIYKLLPDVRITWQERVGRRRSDGASVHDRQVVDRALSGSQHGGVGVRRRRFSYRHSALDLLLGAGRVLRRGVHQGLLEALRLDRSPRQASGAADARGARRAGYEPQRARCKRHELIDAALPPITSGRSSSACGTR